ncbi:MAG: hypothetical protein AB7O21_19125 [Gammaproteobacteria bacterium]
MTAGELQCWRCGASLADEPLPLARAAQCRGCHADLHVCRLCEFHARGVANECREPIAERVVNKERANFCGYFRARAGAWQAGDGTDAARAALDALFGGAPSAASPDSADAARAALDDLFRKS